MKEDTTQNKVEDKEKDKFMEWFSKLNRAGRRRFMHRLKLNPVRTGVV